MKKTNESTKTAATKHERAKRKFFLYVMGKGILVTKDGDSVPAFNDGEVMTFDSMSKARFAKDFLLKVKFAESIDILTKVA